MNEMIPTTEQLCFKMVFHGRHVSSWDFGHIVAQAYLRQVFLNCEITCWVGWAEWNKEHN